VCSVCGGTERLHGCLQSVFIGCWRHLRDHLQETGQALAMDLERGVIYSTVVKDYVYDYALTPAMALLRCIQNPNSFPGALMWLDHSLPWRLLTGPEL
jgi:hypothetical protein